MKAPVKVSLEIRRSDGERQETEKVEGRGDLREADGIRFLTYETEEGFRQQIEFWPGKAVVRTPAGDGRSENRMTFRPGERLAADYHTPYGDLLMETYTKEYRTKQKDGEWLEAELDYELYVDGAFASECRMRIRARRA